MLLRGSGQHTGDDYDLTAIVEEGGSGGGVAAAAALAAYADAFYEDGGFGAGTGFGPARDRLHAEIGDEALVDAAGVLAVFNAVVRIADATGIPLEEQKTEMSADFRDTLGIGDYPSTAGKF